MKRALALYYSILLVSLSSAQNSDSTTVSSGFDKVLDLEEVRVITNNAGIDMGCPVKINSIDVSSLDRSASSSRLLALGSVPGVVMISAGGGTLRPSIRGLSGLRITTLYRGAKIESQAWGEDHGIYIPEQGVNRVEIIKGPSALAYGVDGIGGVINFIADTPLQNVGRESGVSYRWFGNTNGYQTSIITRKRSEKTHHSFSGGYNFHNDFTTPDGGRVANSHYQQFFGQGEFGYILDWGLIEGAYSSAYNNSGIIGVVEGWQQSGDHLITTNATLLKWGWKLKPTVTYQLNHRIEYHSEGTDDVELDMSLRNLRYEIKGVKTLKNYINLITGVQGQTTTATNAPELDHTFLPNADQKELGAYLITSYSFENVDVKAAGRGDYRNVVWADESKSFLLGATSLGVHVSASPNLKVSLIGSLSNRAPSIAELSADGEHHAAYRYEVGNPDLQAETSKNLEVNFSHQKGNTSIDLNIYRNQIDNFIHYIAEEGVEIEGLQKYNYQATNALLEGYEFGLRHQENDVVFNTTVAYVNGLDLENDTTLPFIPPITFKSSFAYDTEEFLVFKDFYAGLSYTQTPAFEVLSLSMGFDVFSKATLQFSANNLLNEEYVPVMSLLRELDIPQPGRDFSVRFSLKF